MGSIRDLGSQVMGSGLANLSETRDQTLPRFWGQGLEFRAKEWDH